jgi:hypothetical protein
MTHRRKMPFEPFHLLRIGPVFYAGNLKTVGPLKFGVADGIRTHDDRNHNRKKRVVAFRKRLNQKKAS